MFFAVFCRLTWKKSTGLQIDWLADLVRIFKLTHLEDNEKSLWSWITDSVSWLLVLQRAVVPVALILSDRNQEKRLCQDWPTSGQWIGDFTPQSCDLLLPSPFISFCFSSEASVAMDYRDHTGTVGCRQSLYYVLCFYGAAGRHAAGRRAADKQPPQI